MTTKNRPTKKRATKKRATRRGTASHAAKQAGVPQSSEEFAFSIRELELGITESRLGIGRALASWQAWFCEDDVLTKEWFYEVWRHLPKSRYRKGVIRSHLHMRTDARVKRLTPQQWKYLHFDAALWLFDPYNGLTVRDVSRGWSWILKCINGGDEVSQAALERNFRRYKAMSPKLYTARKHPGIRLVLYINDESLTDKQIQQKAIWLLQGDVARSEVKQHGSGQWSELRPVFSQK